MADQTTMSPNKLLAHEAVVFAAETHVNLNGEAIMRIGSYIFANGRHLDEITRLAVLGAAFDIFVVMISARLTADELASASPETRAMYERVQALREKCSH